MKNNKIILPVILALVALVVAVLFHIFSVSEIWAQMFAALIGAIITMIITFLLLQGQTSSEAEKERNSKVFEEKLSIYQNFLCKLCDVVKDMKIEPAEEIELEFQVAYIAMHTSPVHIEKISEQVRDIIIAIKNGKSDSNMMLNQLFDIADAFSDELYEKNKMSSDELRRSNTIANFRYIIVAPKDIALYERVLKLKELINPNEAKQWIWKETTLVHEFYTDIDDKGNYKDSSNKIVVDMKPANDCYEVTVYTRNDKEQQSQEIAKHLGQAYNPINKRHLYESISMSLDNKEIANKMNVLLKAIKEYRDEHFRIN